MQQAYCHAKSKIIELPSDDELITCGSEKKVREKGYFRLEGKDYFVRDGDILSIRFSV